MAEFKGHTPGPWAFTLARHFVYSVDGGGDVAYCEDATTTNELELLSNLELIAAAPDLLKERDELRAELKTLKGKELFVVVQDMDTDHGGGGDASGVYDTKDKADEQIDLLAKERDANPRLYKYPTSWFVTELELNENIR